MPVEDAPAAAASVVVAPANALDLPVLEALLAPGVANHSILPRSRSVLLQRLRDFVVVRSGGRVVGVGSVAMVDETTAEVGVLVTEDAAGRAPLLQHLLAEARGLGAAAAFWVGPPGNPLSELGFRPCTPRAIRAKYQGQCLRCSRKPTCRQVAWTTDLES